MPDMLCSALQEVQNLLALPAQVHAMIQGGIPWWQIMYTGLMSTDAVLMIEVNASCGLPYTIPGHMAVTGICRLPLVAKLLSAPSALNTSYVK